MICGGRTSSAPLIELFVDKPWSTIKRSQPSAAPTSYPQIVPLTSVPAFFAGWTLLEALHAPHVLARIRPYIAFDDFAHGSAGRLGIRAVHGLRCGFEDHFVP